ncbi:MAG: SDR family NAD(P)-dependent oxidoreductase [Acidobacteriota bacterium]
MSVAGNDRFRRRFGPWALITGASAGLGAEFARQLAARGLDLVLVARSVERLRKVADEVEVTHGVTTRTLSVDLSRPAFLPTLADATDDLDLGLLVSNAGGDGLRPFFHVPLDEVDGMLHLNTRSHVLLARHVGGRILDAGRAGGLLLVASTAGLQPTPLIANYSSSKAYLIHFAQALRWETRGTGLRVVVSLPGPTETPGLVESSGIDLTKLPAPMKPGPVVERALRALEVDRPVDIPGATNRAMAFLGRRLLPMRWTTALWGFLMQRIAPPFDGDVR